MEELTNESFSYIMNVSDSENYITLSLMSKDGNAFCQLSYYQSESHKMYLSDLNVNNKLRGHGLGNGIITEAIRIARKRGCKYLYLDSKKLPWLFSWYMNLGFIRYTDTDEYYSMFKEL